MLSKQSKNSGFSYIDVMIAIVIFMVGILAMLSALSANLIRTYETEHRVMAKQMALSTIESIISAKEIDHQGIDNKQEWQLIRNATGAPAAGELDGIFRTGFNPVREEFGSDGVAGTADDACSGTGTCTNAVSGAVNSSRVLPEYLRQIVITDVEDPERPSPPHDISRRRIEVNIRFFVNGLIRQENASTILTNYDQQIVE